MYQARKNLFWIGLFIITIIGISYIKQILLPFISSMILAYLLHPLAVKLGAILKSKNLAVAILIGFFFLIFTLIFALVLPKIYNELNNLAGKFSEYKLLIKDKIPNEFIDKFLDSNQNLKDKIETILSNLMNYLFQYIISIMRNIWNSGLSILNLVSLIFLTPIISFYFLRDYENIILAVRNFIPNSKIEIFNRKFRLIDNILHSYIRGQMNVCLVLMLYYFVCFKIIGLESSLLLAILCGVLIIIPYIGIVTSFLITAIVAVLQFSSFDNISIIILMFVVGQVIEGNFITPKLIGDKIGLHPVWIIFSMLVCGNLFGLAGMILAIPIAAIFKIIIETLLENYYDSSYYKA